ncbi:hypothetical protein TrVFT333_007674 [Trichoderma virens FT-333]|nr:hypothetical protein TrVFT333_007674 [Trichoderma virens FT-333]
MPSQDRVPYVDGLTEGQGYNTFLQNGCMHGAVSIKRKQNQAETVTPVEVTYEADLVTDYEKLVDTLGISAGAGISKMEIGGRLMPSFLIMEASFLTYLVRVDVRQQPGTSSEYSFNWTSPANPHDVYGDRFISDFVKGGALFARVSIITKDTSVHKEIEEAAKVAFPVYGIDVKVTEEIKQSIDKIHKHSEVNIYLHYVGTPPHYFVTLAVGDDENLLALKETADKFLKDAESHEWKRFAMLEKYNNIPDWGQKFTPLNYSQAMDLSWSVFDDFTQYFAIQKTIRQINPEHYKGGREQRDKLDHHSSTVIGGYRSWVADVSADPQKAKAKPPFDYPKVFLQEVLVAVQSTHFIAQSLHFSSGKRTHFIDDHLHPNAKKLFDVEAYSFGDVIGITNVIFAKKNSEDTFICLIGRGISPGYEEMSHLWVSENRVEGVFDQKINVYGADGAGYIELELEEAEGQNSSDLLFSFYARKAN